jgi:hypothetical protein
LSSVFIAVGSLLIDGICVDLVLLVKLLKRCQIRSAFREDEKQQLVTVERSLDFAKMH